MIVQQTFSTPTLPAASSRVPKEPEIPDIFDEVLVDPPSPMPRLERPVLLIPGGRSQSVGLPTIIHYLTEGSENTYGGYYRADKPERFEQSYAAHGGDVFNLKYTKNFGTIDRNADEIKQAVADIRRVTGADEIDVVAECKGSIEYRQYIQNIPEGEDGVRNLVLLVPPNHGIPMVGEYTRLRMELIERLGWEQDKFDGVRLDEESREAFKSFGGDWKIGPLEGNPRIRSFNTPENTAKETRAHNSITVVAGDGFNQLNMKGLPGLPFPWWRGDNEVPRASAFLGHADNFFFDGELGEHVEVKHNPEAIAKIAEALVTDGNPVHDENYASDQPSMTQVRVRTGLWGVSFAGRMTTAALALNGAAIGPYAGALGVVGAAVSAIDGVHQVGEGLRGEAPMTKSLVGAAGKFAQVVGTGLALAGTGWPAGALISAGLVASAWSWW